MYLLQTASVLTDGARLRVVGVGRMIPRLSGRAVPMSTTATGAQEAVHLWRSARTGSIFVLRMGNGGAPLAQSSARIWCVDGVDERGVLHVKIGHAPNLGGGLPDRRGRQGRVIRVEPVFHRLAAPLGLRAFHRRRSLAGGHVNVAGQARVALRFERKVFLHHLDGARVSGVVARHDGLVVLVALRTGRALVVGRTAR